MIYQNQWIRKIKIFGPYILEFTANQRHDGFKIYLVNELTKNKKLIKKNSNLETCFQTMKKLKEMFETNK